MKPFIETLRVANPVRQSRASSRKRVLETKAGQVRYWQCGQAGKSPDLAISDPSRFLALASLLCPASSLVRSVKPAVGIRFRAAPKSLSHLCRQTGP